MGWNPGVFDLEPFDFTVQVQMWGRNMLNYGAQISTFKDCVFTEEEMFLRPIEDSKVFAGKVMDRKEFEEWQWKVCELNLDYGNSLTHNTIVQLCDLREIYSEYRFWVVKGQIVTESRYKTGRCVQYSPLVDSNIKRFAQDMVDHWAPLDAFVIDIADTPYWFKNY